MSGLSSYKGHRCIALLYGISLGIFSHVIFRGNRNMYLVRMLRLGLIKKALRKFECLSLRKEIDITNVRLCFLPVSRTYVWVYSKAVTNFILDKYSNFYVSRRTKWNSGALFYAALIFFVSFFYQEKKENDAFKSLNCVRKVLHSCNEQNISSGLFELSCTMNHSVT